MKFSEDFLAEVNRIHSYQEDSITVQIKDKQQKIDLSAHFILCPDKLITEWPIPHLIADCSVEDIDYFQTLGIEVLLISDLSNKRLALDKLAAFSKLAIGVEQMSLGAASRTYNLLVAEDRRVALLVNFA
jgi:uncharacterized protein